jgi:N-acetylmuramic acid 6-phosphate (MurNAc-6-P) etherase
MEHDKQVLMDIHKVVNNHLIKEDSADMEKKIKERAFELADKLTNVDQDKVEKILRRMAKEGDDLDDLEALESELRAG